MGPSHVSFEAVNPIVLRYLKILEDMPKSVVDLSEHANRIVNVVKARDGLRGKNEALEVIVAAYEERILDPALRPEFVEGLQLGGPSGPSGPREARTVPAPRGGSAGGASPRR